MLESKKASLKSCSFYIIYIKPNLRSVQNKKGVQFTRSFGVSLAGSGPPTTGGGPGGMAPPLFCKKNAIPKFADNRFSSL